MGGLGNQMFQYAAGLRLAMRRNTTLKLDLTFLLDRTPQENFVFRDFDLSIFNPAEVKATSREVRKFRRLAERGSRSLVEKISDKFTKRLYFKEKSPIFQPEVLDLPDETYLEGFFQNELYFSDIAKLIGELFRLRPDQANLPEATHLLAATIHATRNAICLNVRRADYVTNPIANQHHGVCGMEYFERALARLDSSGIRGSIFVFSDDIDWCQENFGHRENTVIVSHDHAGSKFSTYLWLMAQCQHFIIPNSSFAWWAAWLSKNPNKIVVRPSRWFQLPEFRNMDICPASWIKVSNE
jgi:hypothetical protein